MEPIFNNKNPILPNKEELKFIQQRINQVKDILNRGKTAVFTRSWDHCSDMDVVKKVTKWEPEFDESIGLYDIKASEGINTSTLWVCLGRRDYQLTEE